MKAPGDLERFLRDAGGDLGVAAYRRSRKHCDDADDYKHFN